MQLCLGEVLRVRIESLSYIGRQTIALVLSLSPNKLECRVNSILQGQTWALPTKKRH